MSESQALAYGKKIRCKYYVCNSSGSLSEGFTAPKTTERRKAEREQEIYNNPWENAAEVYIEK